MTDTVSGQTPAPHESNRIGYDASLSYAHADRKSRPASKKPASDRSTGWPIACAAGFRDDTNLEAVPICGPKSPRHLTAPSIWSWCCRRRPLPRTGSTRSSATGSNTGGGPRLLLIVASGTVQWESRQQRFDPQLSDAAPPALTAPGACLPNRCTSTSAPIRRGIHGRHLSRQGNGGCRSNPRQAERCARQRRSSLSSESFAALRAAAVAALALITVLAVVAAWGGKSSNGDDAETSRSRRQERG